MSVAPPSRCPPGRSPHSPEPRSPVALVVAPGAGPGVAAAACRARRSGHRRRTGCPATRTASARRGAPPARSGTPLSRGTLNEVYYPRIDTPSLRDSQFVVTDGSTFTDREDRDATHQVQLLSPRQPDLPAGQHGQERRVADHQDVRDRPGALHGAGGRAVRVADRQGVPALPAARPGAVDDRQRRHRPQRRRRRAAVVGRHQRQRGRHQPGAGQDVQRLPRHLRRVDRPARPTTTWTGPTTRPTPGNVVQTGRVKVNGLQNHQRFTVSIGFGATESSALSTAQASLGRRLRGRADGVRQGLGRLPRLARPDAGLGVAAGRPSGRCRRWSSPAARTRPCAAASSLRRAGPGPGRTRCSTWRSTTRSGRATSTRSRPGCSRSATTRRRTGRWTSCGACSSGRTARSRRTRGWTARRCSATCRWTRWRSRSCWRTSSAGPAPADWDDVKLSADYVVAHGPRTPQERWENATGYSPATIAAEIAGLVLRRRHRDEERRRRLGRRRTWRRPTSGSRPSSR